MSHRSWSGRWNAAACGIVALALAAVAPQPALAHGPFVFPPNLPVFGMTYKEWSARWWQWALSLPAEVNPFFDQEKSCSNGASGQLGPVWFLTGVINASGTAVRDCTIPAGKLLFFPIINAECSSLEAPPSYGANESDQRACVRAFAISNVFAQVDGVMLRGLQQLSVESPQFNITLPPNNALGLSAGFGQSVSKGYYAMLAPLSVGRHRIRFGGTFTDFGFSLDITYNITIVPR